MRLLSFLGRGRARFVALVAAVLVVGGLSATAVAATHHAATPKTPSNAVADGHGIGEYGMTSAYINGHKVGFTYTKGFFCDTSVTSSATSGCEGGATYKKTPSKNFDPLYILVPLGFNVPTMSMDCPSGLVCVDHPGTIDLRRLEPALKPLYPQLTDKQLTAALANYATPGHEHFITTRNGNKPEWWDVKVVGVTKKAEYNKIVQHKSAKYLLHEVKAGKTTGVIPTNLFLFFGTN